MEDAYPAALPVDVVQAYGDALRGPDAGVEEEEEEGVVATAGMGRAVLARKQRLNVLGAVRLDDLLLFVAKTTPSTLLPFR